MKAFSGKFVLRIPLELHGKLANLSATKKVSLNQLCVLLLNRGLATPEALNWPEFEPVIKKLKDKFQDDLVGVILFGSQAKGEATPLSDTDILIVLSDSVPLNRSLYKWWDDEIIWERGELSPHFVSHPTDISSVSGLWFEVALSGKIIFQKNAQIEQLFLELKKFIADGNVRRYMSNGHPYWVRKAANEE